MEMHNPAHAGEILRECLNGCSITEVAKKLGITRTTLSRIINGKQAVTADMAIRLSKLLPNTSPNFWLSIQESYDLWQAQQQNNYDFVIPLSQPLNSAVEQKL